MEKNEEDEGDRRGAGRYRKEGGKKEEEEDMGLERR